MRNISSVTLTPQEMGVLNKGLKFIPNHLDANMHKEAIAQLTEMGRKMQCRFRFSKGIDESLHPLYTSTGYDPGNVSHRISAYILHTRREIRRLHHTPPRTKNITGPEIQAINSLVDKQESIVISKADKNSTIIVMDRDDYNKEGLRQLNDIHYQEVNNPPSPLTLRDTFLSIIQNLKSTDEIDEVVHRFLSKTSKQKKWGHMYLLPKIHKLDNNTLQLAEKTNLKHTGKYVPSRPIISQCSTPGYFVGKFLDVLLLPFVQSLDTYVRDTPAFVRLIEDTKLPDEFHICSYDVSSMYTVLDLELLLDTVSEYLPDILTHPRMPETNLKKANAMKLLELILRNNYFEFNGQTYLQTIGAAMGSTVSPEICDITLHCHLNAILKEDPFNDNILLHVRYRDDGFIIAHNTTEDDINAFFTRANRAHERIKFTHTVSTDSTIFLDTEVFKGPRFLTTNTLDIKTYVKPTETYQFLGRKSYHPEHTFKGFMKGRMITFIRNNSQKSDLLQTVSLFKEKLAARGYKTKEIATATNIENYPERKILLRDAVTVKKTPLVFVIPFSETTKSISKTMRTHWNEHMTKSKKLRTLFPIPPTIAFKRNKNLKELLARRKHRQST